MKIYVIRNRFGGLLKVRFTLNSARNALRDTQCLFNSVDGIDITDGLYVVGTVVLFAGIGVMLAW